MICCTMSSIGLDSFFAGDIKIWLTDCSEPAMLLGYVGVCMTSQGFSLGARTSKNRKGGSGKRGGVEVYTEEC